MLGPAFLLHISKVLLNPMHGMKLLWETWWLERDCIQGESVVILLDITSNIIHKNTYKLPEVVGLHQWKHPSSAAVQQSWLATASFRSSEPCPRTLFPQTPFPARCCPILSSGPHPNVTSLARSSMTALYEVNSNSQTSTFPISHPDYFPPHYYAHLMKYTHKHVYLRLC